MRKALYFMGVLDDLDLQWMVENGTKRFIQIGTRLVTEGLPIDSLYIVLEGGLAVSVKGHREAVANLRSGEIVGEISFVDARPPLASVTATQNSHVLEISRTKLHRKLQTDLPFAARFYHAVALFLVDRLRITSGRLGYGNPQQDDGALDELDDSLMDNASMGALRFDGLLQQLSIGAKAMVAHQNGAIVER